VAGFDDVVGYDFVEDAHGFGERVVVVAEGEEEGFYWGDGLVWVLKRCGGGGDEGLAWVEERRGWWWRERLTVLRRELLAFLPQSHTWLCHDALSRALLSPLSLFSVGVSALSTLFLLVLSARLFAVIACDFEARYP